MRDIKYSMLPDADHPIWIQFVTGKKTVESNKATINMLIQGNKMNYKRDPSPENVKLLVVKTHKFLSQFEAIFYNEIAKILS